MDELDDKPGLSGAPGWFMPLVSLMAMLLAVCVLLLSISRPDPLRLAEATASIRATFGLEVGAFVPSGVASDSSRAMQEAIAFEQAIELVRIKEKLERMQSRLPDAKGMEVMAVEEGFLIRLSRGILFVEGSVTVRPEVVPLLKELAQMYARIPNIVRIDSHGGESRSVSVGGVASVWASSAAEAATLADFMVTAGGVDPARLIPAGHPAPRAAPAQAREESRRPAGIEILLTREIRAAVKPLPDPAGVSPPAAAAPGGAK
ncbi:MAG: hypothetical protein HQL99_01830 [Magnetococcales bacterium]|nr:hypothetical protein [Magnetococcales bacterium]